MGRAAHSTSGVTSHVQPPAETFVTKETTASRLHGSGMLAYVIRRLLYAIPILIGVTLFYQVS